MALRIEFAAEFKDSERISKILNELNDQMSKLASTGAAVGQGASRGFEQLASSLKGFDDATKGLKSIKELGDSISSLGKLQGEVGIIDKMFSDVGRSISRNIGDEKAGHIRKLRDEIDKLRQDAEKAKTVMQEAEYNYKVAESRGDERAMGIFDRTRRAAAVASARADREAELGEDELDERQSLRGMFQDTFGQGSRGGRMLRRGGRIGGYLAAGLAGVQAADDLFNVMPERAFAAEQRYDVAQAREAQTGDITRQVLREMNVGAGATSRGELGNNVLGQAGTMASTALQTVLGNTIGNIFNLLSGKQVEFKGPSQIYYENLMNKEAVDKETFGLAFGRVGQMTQQRMNMFQDVERFGGMQGFDRLRTGLYQMTGQGITQEMAQPMIQMLMRAGVMATGEDSRLVLAQQRLGAGDNFMQQAARVRFMQGGGAANDLITNTFAGAGLTGFEQGRARGVLGEAMGNLLGQTSGYDTTGVGAGLVNLVGETVGGTTMGPLKAGEGFLTPEEATRGAVKAFGAGQAMLGAGGVNDAVMMGSLARMGITNPIDQQYIAAMIRKNPGEAGKLISEITNKSPADALKTIQNDVVGMSKMYMGPLMSTSKIGQARATALLVGGEGAVGDRAFEEASKGGPAALIGRQFETTIARPGQQEDVDRLLKPATEKERTQAAQAAEERAVHEATQTIEKTIGRAVVDEIAKGFTQMAEAVRKSADKFKEDTTASRERTQNQNAVGRGVAGPGREIETHSTILGNMFTGKKPDPGVL